MVAYKNYWHALITKQTYEFAATHWEKIIDIELQLPKLQWINLRSEAAKFIILNIDF